MRRKKQKRSPFRIVTDEMVPYAYLYHATWKFNLDSIMAKGLLPQDNGASNYDCPRGVYLTHDAHLALSILETTENENIDPDTEPMVVLTVPVEKIFAAKLFVDNCYHFDEDLPEQIRCYRYDLVIPPTDFELIIDTSTMNDEEISIIIQDHQDCLTF